MEFCEKESKEEVIYFKHWFINFKQTEKISVIFKIIVPMPSFYQDTFDPWLDSSIENRKMALEQVSLPFTRIKIYFIQFNK